MQRDLKCPKGVLVLHRVWEYKLKILAVISEHTLQPHTFFLTM